VALSDETFRRTAHDLVTDALRDGHPVTIRVQGCSMMPAIWPGDLLTIHPTADRMPAVGEIALTVDGDRLRAHRVIAHRHSGSAIVVETRGDALITADEMVGPAEILGTVVLRNGCTLANRGTQVGRMFGWLLRRCPPLQAFLLSLRSIRRKLAAPFQPSEKIFA
jgi:hypothetical protein